MKKFIATIILFISSFNYTFSQNNINKSLNNEEIINVLTNEIKAIHTGEDFVLFLKKHAANYEDFDSLYTIMENKTCPPNFTYNLVHGDSSEKYEIGNRFLYLISRNFWPNFDQILNKTERRNYKAESFYNIFTNSYNIIKPNIKNKIKFNINPFSIESKLISNHTFGYSKVNNNLISILELIQNESKKNKSRNFKLKSTEEEDDKIDFKLKKGFKLYKVEYKGNFENGYWKDIKNQDENFLKNDLGGSVIAENISNYISAQVFGDIGFIYINNKIIFLDLDR